MKLDRYFYMNLNKSSILQQGFLLFSTLDNRKIMASVHPKKLLFTLNITVNQPRMLTIFVLDLHKETVAQLH